MFDELLEQMEDALSGVKKVKAKKKEESCFYRDGDGAGVDCTKGFGIFLIYVGKVTSFSKS